MPATKNKIKKSKGEQAFNFINYVIMISLSLVLFYPLYYVVIASFCDSNLLVLHSNEFLWRILSPTIEAYRIVFGYAALWRSLLNTAFVLIVGVTLSLVLTIMGAYFMARDDLAGQKLFSKLVIFTMFFNGGMIPFYITVRSLGLSESLWALILPTAVSTYNMIIMRTAIAGVPKSLFEAAEIDGANDFLVLWKIIVPVVMSTVMVLLLYYAVGQWNAWFNAMIFISNQKKWPLQLFVRSLIIDDTDGVGMNQAGSDSFLVAQTVRYALIVVSTVPILFVYPFVQKYFMNGVMVGAVKG